MADDKQPGPDRGPAGPLALFVMEQTLGHVTHTKNLQALVPRDGGLEPEFILVPYAMGRWAPPGWSNWTVRAGVRAAWRLIQRRRHGPRPAAMFVHTQVPGVLLGPWMRRTPTVVSIDATPKQYDELGDFYSHNLSHQRVEDLKYRANVACFRRARHLVSWSHWGKQGLVEGYGVDPDKVTVISPGVDLERFQPRVIDAPKPGDLVRILFVGGDLHRKGGDLLVQAFRTLRDEHGLPPLELHLVTTTSIQPEPGVVVHHGLTSNSTELIELYRNADLFCLPTLGDCLPMVLAEAAAVGLPLVASDVGAIREIVRPGETGELIAPHDLDALTNALRRLLADPPLRGRYGAGARKLAEADHDARINAARIAAILRQVAGNDGVKA